ncbi:restriction endonuclease subunit S [Coraliomargarita sp. SDUM461004]|uniref:Restriction endonuclease subunit S n=1 Tax=Thalassobacterium sedimentorum TaxID=3041258 RepID=A0ABU1AKZ3_9BACT|nr:restriction endonuclease subunit S [Coraliomargarita sp. SDUM461004]MDQ8195470.1 restriction endonuclease subunit S [Coraliomargarita sp. SDUM461004]
MSKCKQIKMGALGTFTRGRGGPKSDEEVNGIPCVRYGDIYTKHGAIIRKFSSSISPQRLSDYTTIRFGDIVFAASGETFEEIGKATVFLGNEIACVGGDTIVFKPNAEVLDSVFCAYAMGADDAIRHRSKMGQGSSVIHISGQHIASYEIPLPPLPQQRRIAEILSTVDDAIEATETLIAKQQQIKQGLMHDLFTRGVWTAESIARAQHAGSKFAATSAKPGQLRPPRETAPELYQESPLGWIPKDWEVKELGTMSEIVSGVTLNASSDSGVRIVPYLRVANVQDGYLDLSEVKTVCVSEAQFVKLQLRQGDVLMNEGGDFDKLGRGTVWNCEVEPCVHQNHVFRVRPKAEQLDSHYLAFWSQSHFGKKYFVLNSKQSTNLASINSTQLNKFPVFCSSLAEQQEIVRLIGSVVEKVGALTAETAKLQKQKQGLMQDLLSGEVQVS